MRLTQRQEWLIARYLRAFGEALEGVPEAARERAVAQLKTAVYKQIERTASSPVQDEDVMVVLEGLGSPIRQAEVFLQGSKGPTGKAEAAPDYVWLGVCVALADRFDWSPRAVRWAFLAAGITGPVAVIAYLALFLQAYFTDGAAIPQVNWFRVAVRVVVTIVVAVAIHLATKAALYGIAEVYVRLSPAQALPDLGQWDWLRYDLSFLVFLALFTTLPLSALSAFPLAHDWDKSLKLATQALLALYALVLCAGIASRLVGVLLLAADHLSSLELQLPKL